MSKKGGPLDHSTREGVFVPIKSEMFYGRSWMNLSIEDCIQLIDISTVWYREKRIKQSLGGMRTPEHRQNLGLCA